MVARKVREDYKPKITRLDDGTTSRTVLNTTRVTPQQMRDKARLVTGEEQPKRKIEFGNDGSINVTENNVPEKKSQKEYNQYNENLKIAKNDPLKAGSALMKDALIQEATKQPLSAEEIFKNQLLNQPLDIPASLGQDTKLSGTDALDLSKVGSAALGGAGAGAAAGAIAGSAVPLVGNIAGAFIGGAIGAIGAGAGAFFYSTGDDKRQAVKVHAVEFRGATDRMQKILNSVNAGLMSPQQADLYWNNELERIKKSRREMQLEAGGLFGEKFAKSLDEQRKIEEWLLNYDRTYKVQFELAKLRPDNNKIITDIAVTEPTETK